MTQLSQCQSINEMNKINKVGKVAAHRHRTKTMHSYTSIASCDKRPKGFYYHNITWCPCPTPLCEISSPFHFI